MKNEDVSKVLNDVQDMKGRQDEMTMKLDQIKRCETFYLHCLFGMITQRGGGWGGVISYMGYISTCTMYVPQDRVGFLRLLILKVLLKHNFRILFYLPNL